MGDDANYDALPGTSTTKEVSPLSAAMSRLDKRLTELGEHLNRLDERLGPVLVPPPPVSIRPIPVLEDASTTSEPTGNATDDSLLVQHMAGMARMAENYLTGLKSLLGRLQV